MAQLDLLRALLSAKGITYLIVPSSDAHNSEYLAPQDQRRAFVSGFDGSAGTALVGPSKGENYLWTDGRYWLQASQQLDASEWKLMKAGDKGVPTMTEKLSELLKSGHKLGVDPRLITIADADSYKAICTAAGATIEWCPGFVDQIWSDRLKGVTLNPAQKMPDSISGRSLSDKLAAVRTSMKTEQADYLILSMLDEIAWLLNLRGSDIPFNPVFFAFVLVSADSDIVLFIDSAKVTSDEVQQHLKTFNITIKDYDLFYDHIASLKSSKVWLDSSKANAWTRAQIKEENKVSLVDKRSPIADMKACKNEIEIEGMKKAHILDGAALVEFFAWLEAQLAQSDYSERPLTEYQVAEKELQFRQDKEGFVGPSFDTISSVGPNAAIIHYKPPSTGSAALAKEEVYLNDSGGQYANGTTDVTRTWYFGASPKEEVVDAYTRVLLGFIGLARARFPEGANGFALDVLARNALWQAGMDYKHGTGHGVGHYLNVHEAPPYIGIWRGQDVSKLALQPGMCTSIEPGYYENGQFGIRIENVAYVVKSSVSRTSNGQFLEFEQLTMAPIAKKLINKALLSATDVAWLDDYHAKVWLTLSPIISTPAQDWLKQATSPL
jgi:Xaa-Pro aminopeptidase